MFFLFVCGKSVILVVLLRTHLPKASNYIRQV